MKDQRLTTIRLVAFLMLGLAVSGCARWKNLERINREQASTIAALKSEIAQLNDQLGALFQTKDELAQAKSDLEKKLKVELGEGDLALHLGDRGLVVSVLDRVLFDSGRAELKESARQTLDKVAETINQILKDNQILIEGHTDNEPIRYSGWKSNWELSTARATEVVHYFVDASGISPEQLGAVGYGEFRPVADNSTSEGKLHNRRVEIIVTPRKLLDREMKEAARPGLTTAPAAETGEAAAPQESFLK